MNWDALGAAAEIVGALGVLASLIYLAIQIRQNTTWLRQQAFQLSTNEVRQWAMQFSNSPDSAEKTIGLWIEQSWFRDWWGNNEFMFSVAFKKFVNGLLERKAADA